MTRSARGVVDGNPQLFGVPLDLARPVHDALTRSLSDEERAVAARLRRSIDRDRRLAARGWLRALLGARLDTDPARLRFEREPGGRPRLADGASDFSVSSSGPMALIGLASGVEMGVDIERIRADAEAKLVAARFFAPNERADLELTPHPQWLETFFACWTAKEAYLKALGVGLKTEMRAIDVWRAGVSPVAIDVWRVHRIAPGAGYAAAVALKGCDHWTPTLTRPVAAVRDDGSSGGSLVLRSVQDPVSR